MFANCYSWRSLRFSLEFFAVKTSSLSGNIAPGKTNAKALTYETGFIYEKQNNILNRRTKYSSLPIRSITKTLYLHKLFSLITSE